MALRLGCPYCHRDAVRVTGVAVYPHRPDLYAKAFWICQPCKAWVGCHPHTSLPLGRLANPELRKWKQRAHAAFDPLWKSGRMTRHEAYAWLSERMGKTPANTHVGMFDEQECARVVAAVEELSRIDIPVCPGSPSQG